MSPSVHGFVAVVALATACSRSGDSNQGLAGAHAVDPRLMDATAPPPRVPPRFDGGGEDVVTGSPTSELDRKVFDAVRRDQPSDLDPFTVHTFSREKFDKVRQNLVVSPAKFHHSTETEAGWEVVYTVLMGAHELHLVYESRGTVKLADAWIFGW